MGEHAAVIGIGQTKYDAKRIDVSMPGLVREAAYRALEDAGIGIEKLEQAWREAGEPPEHARGQHRRRRPGPG